MFCLSIVEAPAKGQTTAALAPASITLESESGPGLRYTPVLGEDAAMILGRFIAGKGAWRFRAVGQGFRGGLSPLARTTSALT